MGTGFQYAAEVLSKLAEVASPKIVQAVKAQVGLLLVADVRESFQSSTAPNGQPWAPLRFPRPNGGNKPLLNTGRLRNSIVMQPTTTGIVVGTNAVGAATHQFGATIVPKKAKALRFPVKGGFAFAKRVVIPARPFLGMRPKTLNRIEALIYSKLTDAAKGNA